MVRSNELKDIISVTQALSIFSSNLSDASWLQLDFNGIPGRAGMCSSNGGYLICVTPCFEVGFRSLVNSVEMPLGWLRLSNWQ